MTNHLYYGDNLDVLRRYIDAETVDLIYLDPPLNTDVEWTLNETPDLFFRSIVLPDGWQRTRALVCAPFSGPRSPSSWLPCLRLI